MRFIGECPHCGARLEFTLAPLPVGTCASCTGRYTLAVPESTDQQGRDVELLVLASTAEPPLDVVLGKYKLGRPIFAALIAAGALIGAFALLALTGILIEEVRDASLADTLKHVATLVLVDLPSAALLSQPVTWFLFGRRLRSAPGFDVRRSRIALTVGSALLLCLWSTATLSFAGLCAFGAGRLLTRVRGEGRAFRVWRALLAALTGLATFVLALYVLPKLGDWLRPVLSVSDYHLRYLVALTSIVGCAVGWITARIAARAPYRHALGAVLVVVLALALIACVFEPRAVPGSLVALIYLPLLLFGAWLRERAERGARARAAG